MNVLDWTGEPISRPGAYRMPIDAYHSQCCDGPSVSSGGLRRIEQECPASFWAFSDLNPHRFVKERSDALDFGRAAHALMLGDEDFEANYAVRPQEFTSWQTKAAKEWRDAQAASGKTVITAEDLDHIGHMAGRLKRHPLVMAGLLDGLSEVSVFWKDATGVWVKVRPDIIPRSGDVADLKTCASAHPNDCRRDVTKFGYHMQMALYMDGLRTIGVDAQAALILFAQKSPPYTITPIEIDEDALYWARMLNRRALDAFARGVETGEWPDYADGGVLPYTLPEFVAKRLAEAQAAGDLPNLETAA